MKQITDKTYIAIDLKSFYASVECIDRGLDPLTTNLVVADSSRTEKTICLAVTPALKSYGIPGRARLFEVIQKVKEANSRRRYKAKNRELEGKSTSAIMWGIFYCYFQELNLVNSSINMFYNTTSNKRNNAKKCKKLAKKS